MSQPTGFDGFMWARSQDFRRAESGSSVKAPRASMPFSWLDLVKNPRDECSIEHCRILVASAQVASLPKPIKAGLPSSPIEILREAITAVPSVKYALGVAGVAAAIALVAGFVDLRVALVGIPITFVFMVGLVLFSRFADNTRESYRSVIQIFVWFCVSIMIICTVMFAITFFVKEDTLSKWGLKGFYDLFGGTPDSASITEHSKGWAFFGAQNSSGKWFYKHFRLQSEGDRPPRVGDTVVSIAQANLRQGPIENTGPDDWSNQPKIGTIEAGSEFTIERVSEVNPGFYWIELK